MSIQKGVVWAIVPARSGSTSIRDKNITHIAGHPLIAYSIVAATLTPNIDRVIVTTDSAEYAKIANKYGAETPFLRPLDISGMYSTDIEFMQHAIRWFDENEGILPEYWVHLRPTTPLRDPSVIERAINTMKVDDHADCLISVHKTNVCPYKWFKIDECGHLQTICGNTLDEANGPRQLYPQTYVPNGYVDVLRTEQIQRTGLLRGDVAIPFETEESIDIDFNEEMEAIQKLVDRHSGKVMKRLNELG